MNVPFDNQQCRSFKMAAIAAIFEFVFRQLAQERFDELSCNFFVDWVSPGECSFRKPVPPIIQDSCLVDVLDFVAPTVTQERSGTLTLNCFCGLGFTLEGKKVPFENQCHSQSKMVARWTSWICCVLKRTKGSAW
jgi:hypothetical protein